MVGAIKQICGTDMQMSSDRYVDKMHRCTKCVTADGNTFKVKVPGTRPMSSKW